MELRATRELRRNAQLERAAPKKSDASGSAPAGAAPKEPADQLSLSRQALAYVEERSRQAWNPEDGQSKKGGLLQGYLDAMETQKKQLDSMEDKLDAMNKCQKIAAAIMRGDRVPPEDMVYLMEHDQEGYKLALAMRRPKKDPEDVKSVLDEEDRNGGKERSGGEAAAMEAAAPAGGGGEAGPDADA